jgi:Tol biopolymer transport system component
MDANGSNQAIFYNQSSSTRELIPVYSPDGNYILFQGQKGVTHPKYEMFRITSAGASETKLTTYNEEEYFYHNFRPDSTKITYTYGYPSSEQIYTMNLDGTTKTNISNNAYREKQSFWCEAYL